jgi:multiple sugar transport system permease protein
MSAAKGTTLLVTGAPAPGPSSPKTSSPFGAGLDEQQKRDRLKRIGLKFVGYAILIAAALVYILPFVLSAISSFKTDADISKNPVAFSFSRALGSPSLEGVKGLNRDSITFPRWTLNSIFVTTVVVFGRLCLASFGGYALARMQFRGKKWFFSIILLVLGIPHIVLAIPQFIVLKQMNILNTYWAMILPMLFDCADLLVMKQFMEQIPKEMEESAAIDGATRFQTFRTIILPMAAPGLLTLLILRTVGVWNEFLKVLIAVPAAPELRTLPVGLSSLQGEFGSSTPWASILSGAMLTTIPMAILFFVFQRYFRAGLSSGAVKG